MINVLHGSVLLFDYKGWAREIYERWISEMENYVLFCNYMSLDDIKDTPGTTRVGESLINIFPV